MHSFIVYDVVKNAPFDQHLGPFLVYGKRKSAERYISANGLGRWCEVREIYPVECLQKSVVLVYGEPKPVGVSVPLFPEKRTK